MAKSFGSLMEREIILDGGEILRNKAFGHHIHIVSIEHEEGSD